MLFKVVVLLVGFLQIITIPRVYTTITTTTTTTATKGLCTKKVSYATSQYVPYTETYLKKVFGLFYKTKERVNYKKKYFTTYHTISTCCPMYAQLSNGTCTPVCIPSCVNGYCSSPGQCTCFRDYVKSKDDNCEPVCPTTCQPGRCYKPNICTCDKGYQLSEHNTCEPICNVDCKTQNAFCSAPNECTCHESFICKPVCNPACVNGECVRPNHCKCNHGYQLSPNNNCEPICSETCVQGTCVAPETCSCNEHYALQPDSSYICKPICNETCVWGTCIAPNICKCDEGYDPHPDSRFICESICEKTCANGSCDASGTCICNEGFYMHENETTQPRCEPYCTIPCGPHASCTAPDTCHCFQGYRLVNESHTLTTGTNLNNSICEPICENGLSVCAHGVCVSPGMCSCNPGYYLTKGRCVLNCSMHCLNGGHCTEDNVCQCDSGYNLLPNGTDCEPVCASSCANGICVAPNECSCEPGYQLSSDRTACELIFCEDGCQNGACTGPNRCICNEGYYSRLNASTCEPVCNFTCVNGYCGAPNKCICNDGYNFTKDYTNICEPVCEEYCGDNGVCEAPNICKCISGYEKDIDKRCVPVCASCENGNCTKPEVCECSEGYVLTEHESGNRIVCEPYCEDCMNGTCTAPGECNCNEGFTKEDGNGTGGCIRVCVNNCHGHGFCNVNNATCECWYGWTGSYCNESTFCVLVLQAEHANLKIVNHVNETIIDLFASSPLCNHSCFDEIGNNTLCYNGYEENKIACLTSTDLNCDSITLYLTKAPNYVIMVGIAGIATIAAGTAAATYLVIRKRKKNIFSLGIAPTVSIQEQDMLLPEDDNL